MWGVQGVACTGGPQNPSRLGRSVLTGVTVIHELRPTRDEGRMAGTWYDDDMRFTGGCSKGTGREIIWKWPRETGR